MIEKRNIFAFFIVLILVVLLFFNEITASLTNIKYLQYFDELFMTVLIFYILTTLFMTQRISKDHLTILLVFFAMVALSMINRNASYVKIFIQSFIHLKFFIFFYIFREIKKRFPGLLERVFLSLFTLSAVGIIISILLQEKFTSFFELTPLYRYGLLRTYGFQLNINNLAKTCSVFFVCFVFFRERPLQRNLLYLLIAAFSIFVTVIFGSRAILVAPLLSIFFFEKEKFRDKKTFIFASFFIIIVLLLVLQALKTTELYEITLQNIEGISDAEQSSYIRGIMIYYGFVLFFKHFPFGTGAASFGSVLSEGSPVYARLGLNKLLFFKEMEGVYDSNLATVMGEFGLAGLFMFAFLIYTVLKRLKSKEYSDHKTPAYYSLLIILFIIFSISGPTFMHSYTSMLFALALNIDIRNINFLGRNRKKHRTS